MHCARAVQGYTWGSTGTQGEHLLPGRGKKGHTGVHMRLYRYTGRAPAPGEGQEGHTRTRISCHSRQQEQRICMEPGVGVGGTRGDGTGRRVCPGTLLVLCVDFLPPTRGFYARA